MRRWERQIAEGVDPIPPPDLRLVEVEALRWLMLLYNSPAQRFSFEGIFHQATLSDKMLEAYPEAEREAKEKELDKGLDDLSDFEVKAVFNFCDRDGRYGRRVSQYFDVIGSLVDTATLEASEPAVRQIGRDYLAAQSDLFNTKVAGDRSVMDLTWAELEESADEATVARVREFLETKGKRPELKAMFQPFEDMVANYRLGDIYKLIANQPQLYMEVSAQIRDDAVGADTWTAKVVWEKPMAPNVNRFQKYCDSPAIRGLGLSYAGCFKKYMELPDAEKALDAQHRAKIELDVTGADGYAYSDPIAEVLISSKSSTKATLRAGYTRVLRTTQAPGPKGGSVRRGHQPLRLRTRRRLRGRGGCVQRATGRHGYPDPKDH